MQDEDMIIVNRLREDARVFYGFDKTGELCDSERYVLGKDLKWQVANEIERLHRLLEGRDDFIVAQGLWQTFVDQLQS